MTQPYLIEEHIVDLNILEETYPEYDELIVDRKAGQVKGILKEAPNDLYRYTIITKEWKDVHQHVEINPKLIRRGVESIGRDRELYTFESFEDLQAWVDEKPTRRKIVFTKYETK